jgi:hypothetical protein
MVSDMRNSIPELPPFNWEREYGPLWTGSDCSAFWLAPGPEDYLTIDGIHAKLKDHQSGAAKLQAQRQLERMSDYQLGQWGLQQGYYNQQINDITGISDILLGRGIRWN